MNGIFNVTIVETHVLVDVVDTLDIADMVDLWRGNILLQLLTLGGSMEGI